MNDAEYVFKTDCRDKKRTGRGAFNKKGGSKSKKCTLPGDYLTPAQKKKLSKTLVDVNLREPMSYKQFKSLSHDIQREYLIFLRDRFHVGATRISEELFGKAPSTLSQYIKEVCPENCDIFSNRGGPKTTPEELERWYLFLGKESEKDISGDPDSKVIVEKTDKFHVYKLDDSKDESSDEPVDIPEETDAKSEPENSDDKTEVEPASSSVLSGALSFYFQNGLNVDELCKLIREYVTPGDALCTQISINFTRKKVDDM